MSAAKEFAVCLNGAVSEGLIDRQDAEHLYKEYENARDRHADRVTMTEAERKAAAEIVERMTKDAERKKRLAKLHSFYVAEIVGRAEQHEKGFTAGVISHLVRDIWEKADHSNAEARVRTITGELHRMFGDGIAAYRPKYGGAVQDKAGLNDFIKELFGEETGDATARAAAKAWQETSEYARTRFNNAGGDIKKRHDWFLPNSHDGKRIRKGNALQWARFVEDLNFEIRDPDTGKVLPKDQEREALLGMFETISTDGFNGFKGGVFAGRKLANKRADPRLLQFKDADSWLKYNEVMGGNEIFGLVVRHIEGLSRDIGLLETLGPSPDTMIRYLHGLAESKEKLGGIEGYLDAYIPKSKGEQVKEAAKDALKTGRPDQLAKRFVERPQVILDVYEVLTGRVSNPVSELAAKFFGGVRNVLSMAHLGRAPLSAISDLKFLQHTSSWNGLEASKVLKRQMSFLNPRNAEGRAFAARSGLIAEAWVSKAISVKRYQDELVGDGWTAAMADTFHRVTGLTPWTQAGRWAFGLEFFGMLADQSGKAFGELPSPIRRAFKRYGIKERYWDAARQFASQDFKGARFMDPAGMAKSDDDTLREAGRRLHEMVLTETDFAVPSPDARVQAALSQGQRRGSLPGEFWRSSMMYKSFPITVMITHLMRGGLQEGPKAKAVYLADLMIGLTVMGGVVLQLKDMGMGKDPRDMSETEFWQESFFQGGGLGIFGDFVRAGLSRKDKDLVDQLLGPGVGLLHDTVRLTSSNLRQLYDGHETKFAGELVRYGQRYTPYTTLWYTRLATDRLIWNRLQQMADPNYSASFGRMESRARERGQEFWWSPRKASPGRVPDLGKAWEVGP